MARDRRLTRFITEVVAIVGSILLAFAIDAWWDERKEAVEVEEALVGLGADIAETRADLEFLDSLNLVIGATADSVASLLRGSGPEPVRVPVGSLVTLIRTPTFDPPSGELQALLQSARLARIRDREFRKALAAWPAAIADLDETSQIHLSFVYEQLLPALRPIIPLWPIVDARYGPPPDREMEVPASPELIALLAHLRLLTLRADRKIRTRMYPTLEQIEAGLGEGSPGAAPSRR